MANKSVSINLLRGREKNFIDQFLKWALSFGRLVVILTEIIALSTFLFRFSLDRQLIDLHDKIKQKEAMLKLLKNNEDKFRNLQDRLLVISKLSDSQSSTSNLFKVITSNASSNFSFNTLTLSPDFIRMEIRTQSASSLSKFIKSLKEIPKVNSVSIDRIENKTSNATITVNITVKLKK